MGRTPENINGVDRLDSGAKPSSVVSRTLESGAVVSIDIDTGAFNLSLPANNHRPPRDISYVLGNTEARNFVVSLMNNTGKLAGHRVDWRRLNAALRVDPGLSRILTFGENAICFNEVVPDGKKPSSKTDAEEAEEETFGDRNEGWLLREKKLRRIQSVALPLFGIAAEEEFSPIPERPGGGVDEYRRFLGRTLKRLGQDDARKLFSWASLYAKPGKEGKAVGRKTASIFRKKKEFARMGVGVIREFVGLKRNLEEIMESLFMGSKNCDFNHSNREGRRRHVLRTIYFWAVALQKVFPEENLSLDPKVENNWIFKWATSQCEGALERTFIALGIVQKIIERGDLLAKVGVSALQQRLWINTLLGRGGLSAQDISDGEAFRKYITSSPEMSLRDRLLTKTAFLALPAGERLKRLGEITNELVSFASECRGEPLRKSSRRQRLESLSWLAHRTQEEKERVLEVICKVALGKASWKSLGVEEYKPAVTRNRTYRSRRNVTEVLKPILSMMVEYLEEIPIEKILGPEKTDYEAAKTLVQVAQINYSRHPSPFSTSLVDRYLRIQERFLSPNGNKTLDNVKPLNKKEILVLLYVASRQPFEPKSLLEALEKIPMGMENGVEF